MADPLSAQKEIERLVASPLMLEVSKMPQARRVNEIGAQLKRLSDQAHALRMERTRLNKQILDAVLETKRLETEPTLYNQPKAAAEAPRPPVSLPVLPPHEDVEHAPVEQAAEEGEAPAEPSPRPKITPGLEYAIEDWGNLGPELAEQLEMGMVGLHVLPAAPAFSTEHVGRIGAPVELEEREYWAVVTCRMHGNGEQPLATYVLQPLHSPDDWADPVQTALQRWSRNDGKAPEEIPLKGLRVYDPDDEEWILGRDDERVQITVPREKAKRPSIRDAAVNALKKLNDAGEAAAELAKPAAELPRLDFPLLYPPDMLDDTDYARRWYEHWDADYDAPPLTDERMRTLMELPAWCRHLMLDPRLNDHGVRQTPDRKRIHTIPKNVGQAEILLFEDIDGKWWASHNVSLKPTYGSGGLPGPRASSTPADRSDTAYDALLAELGQMLQAALTNPGPSDAEKRSAQRYISALTEFRAEAKDVFARSTATVKHTPPRVAKEGLCEVLHGGEKPKKAKPLAGRRSVHGGTNRKDSFDAWYTHFKATLFPLVKSETDADPWIFDQGGKVRVGGVMLGPAQQVKHLYERYVSEGLRPSDAAREFARSRTNTAAAAAKPKGGVPLGSYAAGVVTALVARGLSKTAAAELVRYDKSLKAAAPAVQKAHAAGVPARELADKLAKENARGKRK